MAGTIATNFSNFRAFGESFRSSAMHMKSGRLTSLSDLSRRELFPHDVIAIAKPYPDALVHFEWRGVKPDQLQRGRFLQINVYTNEFYGLPEALFVHPEINWHGQQFGRKGLIAAGGLWIHNHVASISVLQSDLCQQLYRDPDLRRLCKTTVETRFRYWYVILLNAILDFCLDHDVSILNCPTGEQILSTTRKAVDPDLFKRIYDYAPRHFQGCRKVSIGPAQYWEIPTDLNRDRIERLAAADDTSHRDLSTNRACIFHDIEENIDTDVSAAECADNLASMLEVEKLKKIDVSYNIVGLLYEQKQKEIRRSNSNHSLAFHSFNHDIADTSQLPQCRTVDLRVRGYRPPQSKMTSELTDRNLAYFNFEWLACGTASLGHSDCRLANGLVKIPIHLDDYPLARGVPYPEWESRVLDIARVEPSFAVGLHDCYGKKWLPHYADLIDKLAAFKCFTNADAVCNGMLMG